MSCELAELSRNDDGYWIAECSCGWRQGDYLLVRTRHRILGFWHLHWKTMTETGLMKP